MYERFFGLRERPFDLVPNPRFLYLPPRHREAFSNLQYGLSARRGLTLLVGEAGTGKTTLIHAVLGALGADYECLLLSNPTLTRAEFFEFLADGFRLPGEAARSKTRFLFELRKYLLERYHAGKGTALVLDEAQSLPYELLEEVRLLSNMELATVKLLDVVLAGQPELAARLNEVGLRQLKQRIGLRCEIAPFDFGETAAYVAGRLRIAGTDPATVFTREAIHAIHEASAGLPRTVNVICENSLMGGFAAHVKPVTRAIVQEVCRDFDLTTPPAAFAFVPEKPAASNGNGQGKGSGDANRTGQLIPDRPSAPDVGLVLSDPPIKVLPDPPVKALPDPPDAEPETSVASGAARVRRFF